MTMQMYDVTRTPIAWVTEWAGPHEGGMTLAMKYAWANALDGAGASKSICGKSLVSTYSQRIHGRTFLAPGWARTAQLDRQPSIGALIARRNIERYAGRWGQWLASDMYFRYCPECIGHGYQSLLYQIDALILCPLHRLTLVSTCLSCKSPTSRYALTADAMANPFCCPTCGAPYSGSFNPREWKCAHFHKQAADLLLPLVRFLLQLERGNIEWLRWDEWFGPWLGEAEQREKRIATFNVLTQAITHQMDPEIFAVPERPLSVSRGRAVASTVPGCVVPHADAQPHRSIYKSIRRHLFKRLETHADSRALFNPSPEEVNLRSEILWLSLKKCPFVQSAWLWRLRFEELASVVAFREPQHQRLMLRDEARNWPWQGAGDETAFAHYVLTSFHTAAEIVAEWWTKASALAASSAEDRGSAKAMELHMEFANLLSPSRVPVPPRITALFGRNTSREGDATLYVVGPKDGLERLSVLSSASAGPEQMA